MDMKDIKFNISRYKPGVMDPPRFEAFHLKVNDHMTIIDCLEAVRMRFDGTLTYRHSCHHASCGACAMVINGKEMLACTTRVLSLDADNIIIEPLKGFRRISDLVVDMAGFTADLDEHRSILMPSEKKGFERFENCIECGACDSACPEMDEKRTFMGPAALAAISRTIAKCGDEDAAKKEGLMARAKGPSGADLCKRALQCGKACPKHVYPAMHIHHLKEIHRK